MKTTTLKITVVTLLLLFFASTAHAKCWYNGREYPTGSQIGSKVCGYDGYWR